MAATKTLPARDDRVRRFTRAHSPLQPPKFGVWHFMTALVLALLIWAQQTVPGIMADQSSLVIGNWQAAVVARVTVIALIAYALLFVRTVHPISYGGLLAVGVGLCLRLGEIRVTHEPLTLGFALLLLGVGLLAVRVITRLPEPVWKERA